LQANPSVNFWRPKLNFQRPSSIRPTAISLCVAPGRATWRLSWTAPPAALSQELEAKQTLLDQLRALAAEDPDFLTHLLEDETMATPRKLAQAAADQPGCGAAKPTQPRVYDQTIHVLKSAVRNAKLGREDELAALKRLDDQARLVECHTSSPPVEALIAEERSLSDSYAGRSVFGWEFPPQGLHRRR
jgi:hypothetical protein